MIRPKIVHRIWDDTLLLHVCKENRLMPHLIRTGCTSLVCYEAALTGRHGPGWWHLRRRPHLLRPMPGGRPRLGRRAAKLGRLRRLLLPWQGRSPCSDGHVW